MLTQILAAALAAAVVAVPATAARADQPEYDCGTDSVQQADVTGDRYEGAIWGYVAHAGGPASIRCYIVVNGVEADGTDTAAGTEGVSVVAGRVTFTAGDTDHVQMCGRVTTAHGTFTDCFESGPPWFQPQQLIDVLATVFGAFDPVLAAVDSYLCPMAGDLGRQGTGVPGVITFDAEDGDVYVADQLFLDCPPLEW